MQTIYVLGSLNIDLFITTDRIPEKGETINGYNFFISPGGKGANQAVQAAKLGAQVKMIGNVGDDHYSEIIKNNLIKYNIDIKNLSYSKNTKSGVAIIINSNNDNRIITDPGANKLVNSNKLDEYINGDKNDVLITQFEMSDEVIYKGLKIAKQKNMITILNPAPFRNILDPIYQYIDYLIINQTEAFQLTNIYPNTLEQAKQIYEMLKLKGLKKLIITLGSSGSIYIDELNIITQEAYKVNVKSTVGAGDSFIGTFAYGILNNISLKSNLKYCSAAASIVVANNETQQAMPNLDEIKQFLKAKNK